MKNFTQKSKELSEIKEKLAKSKLTIFTLFSRKGEKGLTVKQMQNLKKNLKLVNSEYCVQKKTLVTKELERTGKDIDLYAEEGSMGVIYGYGEETATAKAVYDFSRKNPVLKMFAGLFGGGALGEKTLIELAKLPNREAMIARFLGMIKYPLSALANVLNQVAQKNS